MNNSQTLTERIIKGSSVVLIFTFIASPIGYLIRSLYAHTLSIEMFGLFYAVFNLFALISVYSDFGLGFSLSYLIPKYLKKGETVKVGNIFQNYQITQLLISITLAVILFFGADILANLYFKSPVAVNLIRIFCIYLISSSIFTALNRLYVGLQKEAYYSSMQLLKFVFIFIFSIIFWFSDNPNVTYYALAWALASVLTILLYYFVLFKKYSFVLQNFSWDNKLFKSMISYGMPVLLTTSIESFIISADVIFITLFRDIKEVGIYSVVFPLATISSLFLSPINAFMFPLTSHLMEGERAKVQHLINQILKLIPFISLYFGLFIALFPSGIAGTLFGGKWIGIVELPIIIFSLGFVITPISGYLLTIINGMGKVKERLKVSVAVVIINILFSVILIPPYGVIGAILANLLAYTSSTILYSRIIGKSFRFSFPYKFYLKLFIFVAACFAFTKYFHINPLGWGQIFIAGVVYTLIFTIYGFVQGAVDQTTIKIFSEKFPKFNRLINILNFRPW